MPIIFILYVLTINAYCYVIFVAVAAAVIAVLISLFQVPFCFVGKNSIDRLSILHVISVFYFNKFSCNAALWLYYLSLNFIYCCLG